MNAEFDTLRARLMALETGLAVATGGPMLQTIAGEAMALAGAIDPRISSGDDWAVTRDGPIGSIIGPRVGVFAIFTGPVPTSVRVISDGRILHVATGDPTTGGSSLLSDVGLDLGALDPRRAGASTASLDEYGRRYIGAMRVTLVDGTEVVANDVIDEFGVSRPIAEVAMDELTERIERGTDRATEAAQDPGETESSTVGLPGDADSGGSVLRTPVGGAGGLTAGVGAVTAVAAAAAIRRLMRSATQPSETPADTETVPESADDETTPESPDRSAPSTSAADAPVLCAFCATALTAADRFCRGCGRPGPEARGEVWAPTHVVPAGGLYAFERPDPSLAPSATLDAGLPLQVQQTLGAWIEVVASNGWTGWVDGRFLDDAQ